MRNWILYVIHFNGALVGYLWVLLLTAIYAAHKLKFEDYGVLTAQWRPWVTKFWKYSNAIARSIVYQPDRRDDVRLIEHENVHIRQSEDLAFRALLLGVVVIVVTGNIWLGLGIWASSAFWRLTNFATSAIRGTHYYRDAEHERSAYAQTDHWRVYEDRWTSWLKERNNQISEGK